MRSVMLTVVLVAATMLFAGCAASEGTPPSAETAPATAPSGPTDTSGGQTYTVEARSNDGQSTDGRGEWKAGYLTLGGGDPRVADAFNSASVASVNDQLAAAKDGASHGTTPWRFQSEGQVTFRPIAVAQLITGSLDYGAHPTAYVGTVVIDSRSATPITLADLFGDDQAGLVRLAEQTRVLLAKESIEVAADEPGLAPTPGNFANWIPTPNGLDMHFPEYQFGSRFTPPVLVPWSAVSDLLAPGMAELAT